MPPTTIRRKLVVSMKSGRVDTHILPRGTGQLSPRMLELMVMPGKRCSIRTEGGIILLKGEDIAAIACLDISENINSDHLSEVDSPFGEYGEDEAC
jgi:hypothetical protein